MWFQRDKLFCDPLWHRRRPGCGHPAGLTPRTLAWADGQRALQVCVRVCKHVCTLPLLGGTETLCWGGSSAREGVICPHFPDERTETWSSLGTNHTNKAEVKGHTAARPGEPFPVPLHLETGDRVGVGSDPAAGIAGGRVLLTHSSVTCRTDAACSLSRACEQQPGPSSPLGLRVSQRSV